MRLEIKDYMDYTESVWIPVMDILVYRGKPLTILKHNRSFIIVSHDTDLGGGIRRTGRLAVPPQCCS